MSEAGAAITLRLRIAGRVQGVGYRAWTVYTARHLGLVGWVRNLTDGSVEALVHGPRADVENLIAAAQAGPPGARVTEVKTAAVATPPGLVDFRQTPTATPE
jgi:acylphosphatase